MNAVSPIKDIVLQTPERFAKTVSGFKEVCQYPHYNVGDGVVSVEPKVSLHGNTCSLLGMSNGNQTYLGHFAPEIKKADFLQKLDYIVKSFEDATGQLSAVVTGALDYRVGNKSREAVNSNLLCSEICEVLDKNSADLTVIADKTNPVFRDCLAVTPDKFILSHSSQIGKSINSSPFNLKKEPTKQELDKLLYDNYQLYEPSEHHHITFEV